MQINDVSLTDDEARAFADFFVGKSRAVERQSKFDADVAASVARILRGEERGIARGPANELRKLIGVTND
jgi:hypothetical protein